PVRGHQGGVRAPLEPGDLALDAGRVEQVVVVEELHVIAAGQLQAPAGVVQLAQGRRVADVDDPGVAGGRLRHDPPDRPVGAGGADDDLQVSVRLGPGGLQGGAEVPRLVGGDDDADERVRPEV